MARHLGSCAARAEAGQRDAGKGKVFLLMAGAGPFWIYFEAAGSSTLEDVDYFLRDLWLECCGHLSAFKTGNVQYCSSPDPDYCDQGMKVPLESVLLPGMQFRHEYDFGTTTELVLKCISGRNGKLKGIDILARNDPPDFRCECGRPAEEICAQCVYEEGGLLCGRCAKSHECGEEMLLPVVNSPRMGMCGYTG